MRPKKNEEYVVVLDFLANGYVNDKSPAHLKTPIAQSIGTENFTLLELVPRKGVNLQLLEKVYVGEGKREKIHHINGKLYFDKLTSTAESELEYALLDMIKEQEQRFVEFFNNAPSLNTRVHLLELLPGLGKKHMLQVIEKRKEEKFKSFKDIKDRVRLMADPEKLLVKRIIQELKGKEKHYIFVR